MFYESKYLEHYGIPKMRWGERRFQYLNGTLTPEGRERYRKSKSSEKTGGVKKGSGTKKPTKGTNDADKEEARKKQSGKDRGEWKEKDVRDLSDEELRRRNNRLQAEQNYKNNMTPQWKKDAKQFNKNAIQEAVKNIFIGTAVTALAAVMAKNYKKAGPIIANASKIAVSKVRSAIKTNTRKTINNAADRYSSTRNKTNREYDYRLGNRNRIRKSHDWPTMPVKDRKKKG